MQNPMMKGKTVFRYFFLAGLISSCLTPFAAAPADAVPRLMLQSARQQINALVINQAGKTLDATARQKQWRNYRYQLNIFIPPSVADVARCAQTPTIARPPYDANQPGRLRYLVSCPGASGWRFAVAVKADIYLPVVMPVRAIARDEPLTANLLTLKNYNISNQRDLPLTRIKDAVGLAAKRELLPLRPVMRNQLQSPLLVQRNQQVVMISRTGNIDIQTTGVALQKGRKGEVIRVRNASSQRIVNATVDDVGTVSVQVLPDDASR